MAALRRTRPTTAASGDACPAERGKQGRRLGRADGDEQPARGLGVVEERLEVFARGLVARDESRGVLAVALDRARDDAGPDEVEDAGEDRDGGAVDLDLDAALGGHLPEMPGQAEPGDVGGRGDAGRGHGLGGGAVEGAHGELGLGQSVGRGPSDLAGEAQRARADGLGQDEQVAGPGLAVHGHLAGIDDAGHGEAELDLAVLDAVAAEEGDAGFAELVDAALEHPVHDARAERLDGEGDDRQGGQGLAAHGVDVAHGVGRGDLAEGVGIVDDGREDVDGLDEGGPGREPVDPGVVAGVRRDEDARVDRPGQAGEGPLEVLLADLGGAAGVLDESGQSDVLGGVFEALAGAEADVLLLEEIAGAGVLGVADAVAEGDRPAHDALAPGE